LSISLPISFKGLLLPSYKSLAFVVITRDSNADKVETPLRSTISLLQSSFNDQYFPAADLVVVAFTMGPSITKLRNGPTKSIEDVRSEINME
jgi:hypothetical protein